MAQIKVNVAYGTTGTLATANIADLSVTTAKIAADAVTDAKVADDVIGTEHLTAGEVDATALGADSVTAAKIGDNVLNSEHYAAASIDNEHLADDAVDSDELAAGAVDTAHIADNQVTLAKMAGLARGKLIYGDASGDPAALAVGSADEVLTHDGTDLAWAAVGGGITAASQWRVTAVFSDSADPIASNWELADTDGYGSLGSNMTESSGIFTFPSTGFWLIQYYMWFNGSSADDRYVGGAIQTTTDNSSYGDAATSNTNIPQGNHGTSTGANCSMSFLFDVTNTTNDKVRFNSSVIQSSSQTYGNTGQNDTHVTFTRLRDT